MARPIQGQVLRYVPGQVPDNKDDLPRFLRQELEQIRQAISLVQDGQLDVTTVAPSKPRDGMLRRADGSLWNPGSGQGVYCYYNGAWRYLG
jgi:hypothetical protein